MRKRESITNHKFCSTNTQPLSLTRLSSQRLLLLSNKNERKKHLHFPLNDAFHIIMLGLLATLVFYSQGIPISHALIGIRIALETIKVVLIKCMKNRWNSLATQKELKNFINNQRNRLPQDLPLSGI